MLDRLELAVLAAGLLGGLAIMVRALGRVRSVTARRQLRWIVWGTALGAVPFALGYALPCALGFDPPARSSASSPIPLGFIPLAFASAIVRYRLMDVEVIIKRTLVYAAALAAIATIYAVLLQLAGELFVDARRPVAAGSSRCSRRWSWCCWRRRSRTPSRRRSIARSTAIATTTAARCVGFARELNTDLDLTASAERLVIASSRPSSSIAWRSC